MIARRSPRLTGLTSGSDGLSVIVPRVSDATGYTARAQRRVQASSSAFPSTLSSASRVMIDTPYMLSSSLWFQLLEPGGHQSSPTIPRPCYLRCTWLMSPSAPSASVACGILGRPLINFTFPHLSLFLTTPSQPDLRWLRILRRLRTPMQK